MKYLLSARLADRRDPRGGITRAEMINALKETPQNANKLANTLNKDYRIIRHHLNVINKNGLVTSVGVDYGTPYFLSEYWEENFALFEEIMNEIWEKEKREDST